MTKEIPLTQGLVALVDEADYERVSAHKWFAKENRSSFYATMTHRIPDGRTLSVYMHRFLLQAPPGYVVDHIDGNGLNNTRANIRVANHSQNASKMKKTKVGKSGFKGVRAEPSGRFVATICKQYKARHIGTFDTAEEAARAYDRAAVELFGIENCALNFPLETPATA